MQEEPHLDLTEVKVKPISNKSSKAKAFVAITFNHLFKISGIELIDDGRQHYLQYPTYTRLCGEVKPASYPICEKFQQKLLDSVLEKYWEAKNKSNERPSQTSKAL